MLLNGGRQLLTPRNQREQIQPDEITNDLYRNDRRARNLAVMAIENE
jgi:hypothetical protein